MRVLYFSPVPWHSFVQRPQHFVQFLLRHKQAEVCWVDPYPTRLPGVADLLQLVNRAAAKAKSGQVQNSLNDPALQLVPTRALPIEPLPGSLWLNRCLWASSTTQIHDFLRDPEVIIVVGKPSKQALDICRRYSSHQRVYDAMDNFGYYYHGYSRYSMLRLTQALQAEVNQIWASCHSMYGLNGFAAKTQYVLNACDLASLPPVTERTISQHAPVFGFLGTVSERFDWQIVSLLAHHLAQHLPAARLRIIGPLHHHLPDRLPANIECLPACSHSEAIAAMQSFDVAMIPFHENLATNSIDPVKFYEYHALGLPILSSYFGEMKQRTQFPGVYVYQRTDQVINTAMQCLNYQADLSEIQQFRADHNWQARFEAALAGLG